MVSLEAELRLDAWMSELVGDAAVRVEWNLFVWLLFLFLASARKACSQLKPVYKTRVCIICVHRRYAMYDHVSSGSFDHFSDSYCLVRSLMSVRRAAAAFDAVAVDCWFDISIARNIRERKVGKSRRRSVGRCRGLIEMVPVVGSITIFCMPVSALAITMPLVEPGAAMYGSRLGSGVLISIEMGANLASSRHFLTKMSSWLKDHSSAARRVARGGVGIGGGECMVLSELLLWFCTLGVVL